MRTREACRNPLNSSSLSSFALLTLVVSCDQAFWHQRYWFNQIVSDKLEHDTRRGGTIMAIIKERHVNRTLDKQETVVLSKRRYDKLMEDLHDLAIVAERREQPMISLAEMKKRLHKRGVL
jgi:hypothetical protein